MMPWLYRLLGLIPKEEPRYGFTIFDGKLIEFDEQLTTWQAVAQIGDRCRDPVSPQG